MQPHLSKKHSRAFMPVELMVVLFVVALVLVLVLPWARGAHTRSQNIRCISNQKQISLAAMIWAGDNQDNLPMGVSITNGGSMEDALVGRTPSTFTVMSNELSTPYILCCPSDSSHQRAVDFANLTTTNLSYFVCVDDTNAINPQAIRFGDRHLELSGRPVRAGLAVFSTNDAVTWSAILGHKNSGNISLGDGSVQSTTSQGLQNFFQQTGMATNRFAIP